MKGTYILLINLPSAQIIKVGSLGETHLPAGQYAYVGSAMGGFKSRLPHHFRESKKAHWHIDYLLQKAQISSVIISESGERNECTIAKAFSNEFKFVEGFGSSDCKCKSHLFILKNEYDVESKIVSLLRSLGYPSEIINNQNNLALLKWSANFHA